MTLWSFRPQIQMCLTPQRAVVVLSRHLVGEEGRLVRWLYVSVVEGVMVDQRIAFVPSHGEVLYRCHVVDVT